MDPFNQAVSKKGNYNFRHFTTQLLCRSASLGKQRITVMKFICLSDFYYWSLLTDDYSSLSHVISDCYYDGISHDHGERWSPGPCTPECRCDDGKIRCTLIECPELTCHNPIKKRWKCCPECPAEEGEIALTTMSEDLPKCSEHFRR